MPVNRNLYMKRDFLGKKLQPRRHFFQQMSLKERVLNDNEKIDFEKVIKNTALNKCRY